MAIKIALVQTTDRLVNQLQQNIRAAIEPALNFLLRNYSGWIAFNPSFQNLGVVTVAKAVYRRQGPEMHILVRATTGTAVAATASMTLPAAAQVDTGVVSSAASTSTVVGQLCAPAASTNTVVLQPAAALGNSSVFFAISGSMDTLQTGGSIGSTTAFTFRAQVPIAGWGG